MRQPAAKCSGGAGRTAREAWQELGQSKAAAQGGARGTPSVSGRFPCGLKKVPHFNGNNHVSLHAGQGSPGSSLL